MMLVKQKISITEEITKIASADGLPGHGDEDRGSPTLPVCHPNPVFSDIICE
jgi:hypothetical protein